MKAMSIQRFSQEAIVFCEARGVPCDEGYVYFMDGNPFEWSSSYMPAEHFSNGVYRATLDDPGIVSRAKDGRWVPVF